MKNVLLLKKTFLTLLLLLMVSSMQAQSLTYGTLNDPSLLTFDGSPFSISGQTGIPSDIAFSADGMRMYIVATDNDEVYQYSLTNPYDVTSGVSFDGNPFSVSAQETSPNGLAFSADGTKMFVTGFSGNVNQYDLETPFSITAGVSVDQNFRVSTQSGNPTSMTFNSTGSKMYIVGRAGGTAFVHQYSLSNVFDIGAGVTYDGSPFNISSEETDPNGIAFNVDGSKMFIAGVLNDKVNAYTLTTPFDITSGVSLDASAFNLSAQELYPTGVFVTPNGNKLFITGFEGDEVNQFDFNIGGFEESASNLGLVDGSMAIHLSGETFTEAGKIFKHNGPYNISNVPSGLSPILQIAGDGASATLTFGGSANAHQTVNAVNSLTFTFNDDAFTGGDASAVANAVAASSDIGLDFDDNEASLLYGTPFDFSIGTTYTKQSYTVNDETSTEGLTFSPDGMKMFVVGAVDDEVSQYSLSSPFTFSMGIVLDVEFAIGSQEPTPKGMAFSNDGLKMFIVGVSSDAIHQYSLVSAFDMASGVTYDGSPFATDSEEVSVTDITFNADGTKMYTIGMANDAVNQYSLSNPFDVTSGVTFDGTPYSVAGQESTPNSVSFTPNGTKMFVTGTSDQISSYTLSNPFDITSGVTFDGDPFNTVNSATSEVVDIYVSPTSHKLFVMGNPTRVIDEYDIAVAALTENVTNDGSVDGSVTISLSGDNSFENAGGTLSAGSDYTIENLPSGLTPILLVDGGGKSANLTFTGNATNSQEVNSISNLEFDFANSAFIVADASLVDNAESTSVTIRIDFDDTPELIYGADFNLSEVATANPTAFSVVNEEDTPTDVAFSADGSKMFVLGDRSATDEISQYSLTTPYDITAGVSFDGDPLDIGTEEISPQGVTFNPSGTKMYVVGTQSDNLNQYSLTNPFDITSGVTLDGSPFDLSNQTTAPRKAVFSNDGFRMFILSSDKIDQYTLSTPFDGISGVTYDGDPLSLTSEDGFSQSVVFNNSGKRMYVTGDNGNRISTYSLSVPFDITGGVAASDNFSISEGTPAGIALSSDNTRMFIIDQFGDDVNQYDLDFGTLTETATNDGSLEGSMSICINGETFTNVGGTLTFDTDYSISNLPDGIVPTLTVAADGLSTQLTLTGNAIDHQTSHDVANLQFTFENSAFTGDDASAVTNANNAESGVEIEFIDNSQRLQYGLAFDPLNGASTSGGATTRNFAGLFGVAIDFNTDGTKMFLLDGSNDEVEQYSLATAFDISTGETLEGTPFSVNSQEASPVDVEFSADGTKMYIVGTASLAVNQFGLTTPFDITTGVIFNGSVDISDETTSPRGVTFSADGTKMYLLSTVEIIQYTLSTPFDVTTSVVFDGTPFNLSAQDDSPRGIAISSDGTKIFVLGSENDYVNQYVIATPFDATSEVTYEGRFFIGSQDSFPKGMAFNTDGSQMYIVGSEINQYFLSVGGFSEVATNDGSVEGSLVIRLFGDTFFANANATLTSGIDYSITNLPAGLTPNLAVAAGGLLATLTFTGTATNHQNVADVTGLVFNFENSAFTTVGADIVTNAVNAMTGIEINFDDNPSLIYGAAFDLSNGVTFTGDFANVGVSGTSNLMRNITFSADAMKMYIVNSDQVDQYSLSVAFNPSNAIYEGSWTDTPDFGSEITFTPDGMRLFYTRFNDQVYQFNLTTAYDITSGVTQDGSAVTLVEADVLTGVVFNAAGTKMFTLGNGDRIINQYSLSLAYDITAGTTFDGASYNVSAQDNDPRDLVFSTDGAKMFVVGADGFDINSYELSIPFDISSGVSFIGSLPSTTEDPTTLAFAFNSDGTQIATLGDVQNEVNIYDVNGNDFVEAAANDGSVTGALSIGLRGDMFTNAGTTLTETTDYTISNLPAGLNPVFTVAANGASGILTLTGAATANDDDNDINSLQFTFQNSAFVTEDAVDIDLAVNAESGLGIDFVDGIQIEDQVFSIDENAANVSSVGTVAVTNLDGGALTYTILSGNDLSGFDLDESNGALTVDDQAALDFETNESFDLVIQISDGNSSPSATITINLNDISEAPSAILLSATSVDENTEIEDPVGDLSTTDEDAGETYTYTLVSGAGDTDNASFSIVADEFQVAEIFDFETKNSFSVRIQTDDGNGGLLAQEFTITVTDIAEAPTAIALNSLAIDENNNIDDLIGQLTTTDEDAGETYSYSLVAGDGDTDNASFKIDGDELQANTVFDFETKSTYTVRVETNDGNSNTFPQMFSIEINDVSEAPTALILSANSIEENNSIGAAIGTLSTTDVDAGETFTYTFVSGEGDTDNALFSINSDELQAAEVFNFETKSDYSVRIETNDGNGGLFEQDFAVTIVNGFDTPTNIVLSSNTIAENTAAAGALTIGTLTTTDEDASESYTYTFVEGEGSTDNFAFNILDDKLRASIAFNFEVKSTYAIRLQTDEGNGGFFEKQFSVNITDVAEDPTDISLSANTIVENNSINDPIGVFTTTDPDAGETYTYTLVAGDGDTDNAVFTIVGAELQAGTIYDFETQSSYSIRIQTDDGNGGIYNEAFAISISNSPESPTDIQLSSNDINESVPIGSTVGLLSTTDEDMGETHGYSLVSGAGDTDNASFSIDNNELQSAEVFDFETKTSYSVRIQSNDGNGGTVEETFVISINNQPPGLTGLGITSAAIDENSIVGSAVGSLFALGDEISGVDFTFTLATGNGDTDNAQFSIAGGELITSSVFNFESNTQYSIRVKADDGEGSSIEQELSINVNDVSEAPTDLTISATSVTEDGATGRVVATLGTTDEDTGETYTYSKVTGEGSGNNGLFSIFGNSLRINIRGDFETKSSYTIRLQTDDGNGGTFQKAFTISVIDINEKPSIGNQSFDVSEDAINGFVVGNITASDPEGNPLTFEPLSGEIASIFEVSAAGILTLNDNSNIDFEEVGSVPFEFTVSVGDNGTPVLSSTATIQVTVLDVNESPTDISLSANSISESAEAGTAIGTLSTEDEDDAATHTYALVPVLADDKDNASFEIIGNELRSVAIFDFESQNSFEINVQTTDNGGLSTEEVFTINISDVPPMVTALNLDNSSIDENQSVGSLVGMFSTSGVELSGSYTYTLVSGSGDDDNGVFNISDDQLVSNTVFDFETETSYAVRVKTDDGAGGIGEESFSITINDANDVPTDIQLSNEAIDESTVVGTVIGTLSTQDVDDTQSHTYQLVSGTGDADNASFEINGSDLLGAEVFDFEMQSSYTIRIQADDANGGTVEKAFNITINDLPASITSFELSNISIEENSVIDTEIGSFTTTGEDLSGTYSYTLIVGSGSDGNGAFSIDGSVLRSSQEFDFEAQDTYDIRVMTDDGIGNVQEKIFGIQVVDLSESPTGLDLSANSIEENSAVSTIVGTFSTTDRDAGEIYTYTLVSGAGDVDNANFTIGGDALVTAESFDFESQSTYSVRVQTDDNNGGTFQATFQVDVTDVAEAPVGLLLSNSSLDENNEVGASIGALSTIDEDNDEVYTYAIIAGTDDEDNDAFVVMEDELVANEIFDFETQSNYSVRLQTNDGNGGVFEQSFTIAITDVFEIVDQTISFESIQDKTFGDAAFDLDASASSGLDVLFTVVSGPIEINDNMVTILGAGTAEIAANQAGDAAFSPAPEVTRTFSIAKADQEISIVAIGSKLTSATPFDVEASVDSGLDLSYEVSGPATIDGTTVSLSGNEGTVDVTVSQAGNDDYNMAEATTSFVVSEELLSDQTITFETIEDKVFGSDPFVLEASASSGLDVTFSIVDGPVTLNGNEVTITGAGMVEISTSQSGDDFFNAAPTVTRIFEILKADQSITIASIGGKVTTAAPFDVEATVDSGLDLTYAVSGPATIDNKTIMLSGNEGTVTVTVAQSGNENYNSTEAMASFDVTLEPKSDQTITFESISDKVFGDVPFALEASASSSLDVILTVVSGPITLNGNEVTITGAGTVEVSANQSGDDFFSAAPTVTRTFEILPADQSITIAFIEDKVTTASPFDVEATVDSGLDLTYAINGPATIDGKTITLSGDEGTVMVTVTQSGNENYNTVEAMVSFDVTLEPKSDQTITFESISDKVFGDVPFALEASASSSLDVILTVVSGPITLNGNEVTITGAGTVEVSANQSGDDFFSAAPTVTRTFEILPADQSITIAFIEDKVTTASPFDVEATVDSGLDLTYAINGPATIDGKTITLSGDEGTVMVTVTQSGNENYNTVEAMVSFDVTLEPKSDQTITFESISDKVFGDVPFALEASASSSLDVILTVVSGPVTLNGNEVTITGAGTAEISANQSGDDFFSAAPTVTRTFEILPADQSITIAFIEDKVTTASPFDVEATVDSGLDLTYAISGPATIDGKTITLSGDEGTVMVTVTQTGNENYNVAEAMTSFDVTLEPKSDQTITFESISDKVFGDVPFALEASASSNLDVTLTVVSGPITLNGNDVTITGAGTVEVSANQSGNELFSAAPTVTRTFEILPVDQSITIAFIEDKVTTASPFDVEATVDSGLDLTYAISGPATIDGKTITLSGDEGTVMVTVTQSGNENYNTVEVMVSFDVTLEPKSDQTITFESISDKVFGDVPFALEASASSNLDVTLTVVSGPIALNGNEVTITGAGTAEISASQSGNELFNAGPTVTRTFEILKAEQNITFLGISDKLTTDGPFEIEVSVDTGFDLDYSISGPASIDGTTVTLSGDEGTVMITAMQTGNENYNAAEVSQSFEVSTPGKSDQTVTFEAIADKMFGDDTFELSASASSGLDISFSVASGPITINGSTVTITGAGVATVAANQGGNDSFNPAPEVIRSFLIAKSGQTITFESLDDKTFGDAPFTVSVSSISGLSVEVTIVSGPASITEGEVTLTGAGEVVLAANQSGNANYMAAAEVTQSFNVAKADQQLSIETIDDKLTTDGPFMVVATVDTGLELTYDVDGPATISATEITLTGSTGTVTVTVTQAGNDNYNSASVQTTFEVTEDVTTGIEDLDWKLEAYPNPTRDQFKLTLAQEVIGGQWSLVNGLGIRVHFQKVTELESWIDLSNVPVGMYYLVVVKDGEQQTIRIIKE